MSSFPRSGLPSVAADRLRRIGRLWVLVALAGTVVAVLVRWATAGATAHDWEPPVWVASVLVVVVAAIGMWLSDGVTGLWLGLIAVVGGVSVAAHYGPPVGLIPVVAFAPPAVLLSLAWRQVRTPRAMAVFLVVVLGVLGAGGVAAQAAYEWQYGPAHPASTTPPPPDSPVRWMWAGATTAEGFTVVAGLDTSGPADLLVWPEGDPAPLPVATSGTEAGVVRLEAVGLQAGTTYRYAIATRAGRSPEGTIRTFPSGSGDLVIAFSGCARLGSNGAVYDAIRAVSPDLFVVTGDFFYGDIGPNDDGAFAAAYEETLTRPAQAALLASTSVAYVWDDHDYALNDSDASAPSRPAAMKAYRRFVPHYPLAGAESTIHQSFDMGRVRVIITDTRSARTPEALLGAEQTAWFTAELRAAAAAAQVVVWVNPDPWITDADPGADHWGAFPAEREAISTLVADLGLVVVMLGGDAHMVAIDDGSHSAFGHPGPGMFVVHAGALDRPGSLKGGPYSHGAVAGGGQFGVLEIHDDGAGITLRARGMDWEGRTLVEFETAIP